MSWRHRLPQLLHPPHCSDKLVFCGSSTGSGTQTRDFGHHGRSVMLTMVTTLPPVAPSSPAACSRTKFSVGGVCTGYTEDPPSKLKNRWNRGYSGHQFVLHQVRLLLKCSSSVASSQWSSLHSAS